MQMIRRLRALDLIELDGDDLRRDRLRSARPRSPRPVPAYVNEHIEADGPTVFAHACKMGLEGIVPKRLRRVHSRWATPQPKPSGGRWGITAPEIANAEQTHGKERG